MEALPSLLLRSNLILHSYIVQGSYRSWKKPGNSWNLVVGHIESHGKLILCSIEKSLKLSKQD